MRFWHHWSLPFTMATSKCIVCRRSNADCQNSCRSRVATSQEADVPGLARPPSLLDMVGQANADPDTKDEVATLANGGNCTLCGSPSVPRSASLYNLLSKEPEPDPVHASIKARAKLLVVASFFMSACNTMQSILYVPSALKVTGSPKGANLLLASLHSFCAMLDIFLAPTFGSLTDATGRKPPLLMLSASLCFSRLLMLFPQNKRTLSLSRIVGYFSSSLFSNTLTASILDLTHDRPELGAVYRSLDASAKGWGVVVGPWLAGLVGKRSLGRGPLSSACLPFVLSASFGAMCFLWVKLLTQETLPAENRKPFKPKAKNIFGVLELLGHGPQMNRVFAMSILADVGARTGPIFAVTTQTMFGWDTEQTSRWLLCYGLGMAIGPGIISKHTIATFGPRGAHSLDSIGLTIAASMLAVSRKGKLFWSALLVFLVSLGFSAGGRTAQTSMAVALIPNIGRGELTGRFSSLGSISNMLSPQLYAMVFAAFTSKSAPVYYPGAPFAVAAMGYFSYFVLLQGVSPKLYPWGVQAKAKENAVSGSVMRTPSSSKIKRTPSGSGLKRTPSASRVGMKRTPSAGTLRR